MEPGVSQPCLEIVLRSSSFLTLGITHVLFCLHTGLFW